MFLFINAVLFLTIVMIVVGIISCLTGIVLNVKFREPWTASVVAVGVLTETVGCMAAVLLMGAYG